MGKEAETNTETRADLAIAQDDSVALVALPRRQSSAEFGPRTLNWEEGEDLLFCAIISYHFGPRERRCWIDRSPFCMNTCGSPWIWIWGVERAAGPAAAILGQSDVAHGRGFDFEFGRWLATSTERVRSRSPCGARVRDECSKRSVRSGWTVEHLMASSGWRACALAAVLRNEEGVFSVRETVTYEIDRAIRRNALIWEENGD